MGMADTPCQHPGRGANIRTRAGTGIRGNMGTNAARGSPIRESSARKKGEGVPREALRLQMKS